MHTKSHTFFRTAGLVSATSLALLASTQLSAAVNSDAFPTFDSYIKVTGQAASIKGDASAFQARTGQSEFRDGAGIEDAYYSKDLNKTTTLTVDGHALRGTEDYLLHLNLTKAEVGSVDVGYKRFRTFYDGVGGFFPGNGQFSSVNQVYPGINQDLFVDRGEFWAEVKIARPDAPEFKLRYTNGTRNGQKDSTSWGATDNTGIAYGTLPAGATGALSNTNLYSYASNRRDIPAYLDISERHETLEGSVKHTVGKTTAEVTAIGDWSSKNNGRFEAAYPGEHRAANAPGTGTAPAAGALATNWTTFNNQVLYSNFDRQDTTTKGINGTTLTELGSKLDLRLALGYQDVHSSFGGDRLQLTNYPITGNPTRQIDVYSVKDLVGESSVYAKSGRIAFDYKPFDDFVASLGVRGEDRSSAGNGTYKVESAVAATGLKTTANYAEASSLDEKSLTPSLDLRYSGIRNLALYSTVTQKNGDGTRSLTTGHNITANTSTLNTNINELNTDYTVGANWRACSTLTLRAEPFYKNHSLTDEGSLDIRNPAGVVQPLAAGYGPGYRYKLDSQYYGVRLTAIVRPLNTLTFTNRYIFQKGKMQVASANLAENDSMESTSHTIGETIDWTPIEQFYMQANLDVVLSQIQTVSLNPGYYSDPNSSTNTAVPPVTSWSPAVGDVIPTSYNNYVTYSVLAGVVITKNDDLQLKLSAYRATNHDAEFSAYGMSYGASMSEYTASLALKHKLSKNCIATAKVGYFDSHNDTTGSNTDFHGPLAYVSLDYGL
jgi:hypothetical protein